MQCSNAQPFTSHRFHAPFVVSSISASRFLLWLDYVFYSLVFDSNAYLGIPTNTLVSLYSYFALVMYDWVSVKVLYANHWHLFIQSTHLTIVLIAFVAPFLWLVKANITHTSIHPIILYVNHTDFYHCVQFSLLNFSMEHILFYRWSFQHFDVLLRAKCTWIWLNGTRKIKKKRPNNNDLIGNYFVGIERARAMNHTQSNQWPRNCEKKI